MYLATWNPARRTWETPTGALCGHAAPYRAVWPAAGTVRDGRARRRPELPAARAPRGLLPTPRVSDTNGAYERRQGGPDLRTVIARGIDGPAGDPYRAALDTWARVTRPAPAPTGPGHHQ